MQTSRYLLAAVIGLGASLTGARAQTPPPPAPPTDEAVKLSPFEVQADSDQSYGALNSNSVTAFNTALDRLPISADIFDQAFLSDTHPLSVEDLIQTYSAGAGYSTSDPGSSAGTTQALDRNGTSFIQLRGLSTPSQMRDGYMILGTMDNPGSTGVGFSSTWDLERVEIINGPQALLYGFGGGGGVINMVSKQARLGQPSFGSLTYTLDQYGNKMGQIDAGMGTSNFAVRVSSLDQVVGGRRYNIGGPLTGNFIQVAAKLGNTVIRAQAEATKFNRVTSNGMSLTAASTSNDARNGQSVRYLLATNQVDAAANGAASGAGVVDNGLVNWGNVDSYQGWWGSDLSVVDFYELNADSVWTPWLSTRVSVGWSYSDEDRVNNTFTFYAPNNTANLYPGNWTEAMTGGTPAGDQDKPSQNKVIRASALITKDLFDGKAHTQTMIAADSFRSDTGERSYGYYQADSNFNPVYTVGVTANQGRTVLPKVGWTVNNGPVLYPLWAPRNQQVTYNGVNYVRMLVNPINLTLKGPGNELGVVQVGGANDTDEHVFEKGVSAVNYTQWLGDRLDTVAGVRLNQGKDLTNYSGASAQGPTFLSTISNTVNFNFGVDVKLNSWLRPYATISDSHEPSLEQATDPYGRPTGTATSRGEEAGLKLMNPAGTLSGSIAYYHVNSKNEEVSITSTLLNDINPSGLNGRFGAASVWINVDRQSEGVEAVATASPNHNLRLRFSAAVADGTIGSSTSFKQLYNDQFNEDKNGNVTYADGSIVYVPATFNSKQLTVTSTTAGAVPLTVALMSNSASAYYANPLAVSGQINSGSNAAKVLQVSDPVHGSILTGAVGLPISSIQINPGFTPVGVIPTSVAGDNTTGYPEISFNSTGVYTFSSGWEKGIHLGGTVAVGWFNRNYYYYPNGPGAGATRLLFYRPTSTQVNLNIGYTRKFGRFTWATQLNVQNLLNHYLVLIVPNSVSGYSGPDNATFTNEPRAYLWTNTFSF